jgi:Tol biopolymer transport system component
MKTRIFLMIAAVIALIAIGTTLATATPSTSPPLQITGASILSEIDLLAGPAATSAYLAPDGEHFAYVTRQNICIYTVEGEEQRCIDIEDRLRRLDNETIQWSPDSRYLALTEEFFMTFTDADIWVMDTTTGDLTNLTDDEVDRIGLTSEDWPSVDVVPRWFADGSRLAFLRYAQERGAVQPPELMAIAPDGSGLENLMTVETAERFATYGFDLSPDDTLISYNRYDQETDSRSGVWLSDIDGSGARQLVSTEPNLTPFTVEFSPDGRYLLTVAGYQGVNAPVKAEDSPLRVVNVDTGASQLLDDEQFVRSAGWSPDGSTLAYLVHDILEPDNSGLYIADEPGEPGQLVLQGDYASATPVLRQPLMWAANSTILLSKSPSPGIVIVQLESE